MTAGRNGVVWGLYFFSKFYTSLEEFAFWRVWIPPEGSQSFSVSKKQKQDTHGISHVAEKTDCYSRLKKIFFHICFFVPFSYQFNRGQKFSASLQLQIWYTMHLTKDTDNLAKCFHFLKKVILGDYFLSILIFFLQYFFFLLLLIPFFQYCFDMLKIQTLWKVKGVHILFLFTLFPFLILPGFCNSGYLHNSLHKRRKMPESSVLLKPQLLCSWALSWLLLLYDHM